MNIRQMASAALTACAAQGVSFFVSIVMSFIVPKLLGVESYGYWQLFVFYAGYSGFFHFGLNDGIYLVEGGRSRKELDSQKVASQFWMGIVVQLFVAFVVCHFAYITAPGTDRSFVLFAFAAYTVILNMSGLLGYLFQAINETKRFSYMTMLERGVFLIPLALFVVFNQSDYKLLVLSYIFSRSVALAYAIWMARDIVFSRLLPPLQSLYECVRSIKVGFSLMISNVADMFIMGVSRMLVDAAWGISVFGKVSFSLSIINFFITFVTQASMVLFPALRQGNDTERQKFFQGARDIMDVVFPAAFILYFPLVAVLNSWLPEYGASMRYFALLMPMCMYNAKMYALCQTYYKVLRKERVLLFATCVSTALSTLLSLVGIYVIGSLDAVLLGTVSVIVIRTIWSERYLSRKIEVAESGLSLISVGLSLVFIIASLTLSVQWACALYIAVYAGYLYANRSKAKALARMVCRVVVR